MFVLVRAVIYSSLFIATLLVFVPAQLLGRSGLVRPAMIGMTEVVAMAATLVGAMIALWCIWTFVVWGRGTPAPFDPPRRLVVRGPYRFVRNPMYLGAGLALAGAALFYRSAALLAYLFALAAVTYALVIWYEEPTLQRTFGAEYDTYRRRVRRWIPVPPRVNHSRPFVGPWVAHATALWAAVFAAFHLIWAAGWYPLLNAEEARAAFATPWKWAFDVVVAAMCVIAVPVALAPVMSWGRRVPRRLISTLAWTGTALLVFRATASLAQGGFLLAAGRFRIVDLSIWEPWFWVGAILFTLSTWRATRVNEFPGTGYNVAAVWRGGSPQNRHSLES